MTTPSNLGILGIGTYLPPEVRTNDWWPREVVQCWQDPRQRTLEHPPASAPISARSEGTERVRRAIDACAADPFRGSVERRVMPDGMVASEMEVWAARQALEAADVAVRDIDFLLCQTIVPDRLHNPNACVVHRELGLRPRCFALNTEGMCNAFLQQLVLAQGLTAAEPFRRGLVIQSSSLTRLVRSEDYWSPWFGDGATAVVVGPVADGYGILGHASLTDGSQFGAIVSGVPGARWYDPGRVIAYFESTARARAMLLGTPDNGAPLVEEALRGAGLVKQDINFWACHQGTPWLGRVMYDHLGLSAKTLDTFRQTASLSGANVPFILHAAQQAAALCPGDVVGMWAAAAGSTMTGMVLRWGIG